MLKGCCGKQAAPVQDTAEAPEIEVQPKTPALQLNQTVEVKQKQEEDIFSKSQSAQSTESKPVPTNFQPLPKLTLRQPITPAQPQRPGSQTGSKKERVLIDDYGAQEHRPVPTLQAIDRDQLEDNALVLEAKRDIEKLYGAEYVDDEEMIRALVEKKKQRVKVDPKALQHRVVYKSSNQEEDEEEEIKLIMKIKQTKMREQRELLDEITRDTMQRKQLYIIKSQKENEDEGEIVPKRRPGNQMQEQLQKEMRKGQRGATPYQKQSSLVPLTASRPKLQLVGESNDTSRDFSRTQDRESMSGAGLQAKEGLADSDQSDSKHEDGEEQVKARELREMLGEL